MGRILAEGEKEVCMTTHTYKRVGDLEIKADVYRSGGSGPHPTAVWIHGGALINGHRAAIDARIQQMLLKAGYAVVSIDYRLAPETKLPAIVGDVESAFSWLRGEGGKQLQLDPSRVAVMGASAGGYLTLTTGYRVRPRPTVLVAFWGYGDLIGDWYSKPSPHARHRRVQMSETEVFRQVNGPPLSDARERKGDGVAFYQYCRQHGIWPRAVSGWDPHREADKFFPYMPVKNVTSDYPPTLLIHGTADTDVPYEQSTMMADELKKHGVVHHLISVPNAEHDLAGGDPKQIDATYHSVLEFADHHMRGR